MKIGVLGNCQATLISRWLRVMLPGDEIVAYSVAMAHEQRAEAAGELARCDAIISQWIGNDLGPLASENLAANVSRFVLAPNFTFTGFQPDMVYISHREGHFGGSPAGSPVGVYHSRIVVAGFLLGMATDRVKSLFNSYIYDALGYFDEFTKAETYFDDSAAAFGFSVRTRDLMADGPFMHTINHANVQAGRLISRDAAVLAGASPLDDHPEIEDELLRDTVWPFYPELAHRINAPGASTQFARAQHMPHTPPRIDLKRFIEESLDTYTAMEHTLDLEPFRPTAGTLKGILKNNYF